MRRWAEGLGDRIILESRLLLGPVLYCTLRIRLWV